jgi:hypothetical protein
MSPLELDGYLAGIIVTPRSAPLMLRPHRQRRARAKLLTIDAARRLDDLRMVQSFGGATRRSTRPA